MEVRSLKELLNAAEGEKENLQATITFYKSSLEDLQKSFDDLEVRVLSCSDPRFLSSASVYLMAFQNIEFVSHNLYLGRI